MINKMTAALALNAALLAFCAASPLAAETGVSVAHAQVTPGGACAERGFVSGNTLHSTSDGDIHFSAYIPASYDGKKSRRTAGFAACTSARGFRSRKSTRS